ncbi:hypothetical protein [Floridanema evergladense]|uniref:Uncharacterized protein n=1 Tax=Floridaenema evergladense BLCC-F167 TaxID=3153639 RepID=A0ABV4WKH0_9CYAN
MRCIRFLVLGLVSFVAAIFGALLVPGTWVNRVFSTLVCGIFSFNSMVCTANWGQSSQRVVAATPPAIENTIFDGFSDLLAQRDPNEFGDPQPSTPSPQQSNPQAPPFPQDPGPNFPVRPEFNNPNTNPINPSNSPPSQPNITGRGQGNLTGEWTFKTQDFKLNYDGSKLTCTPVPNAEMIQPTLLNQNGNKLEMQSASNPIVNITFVGEGTLSGNQVNLQSDFVTVTGTLSSDGNQITGKLDCQGVILPFTATRKGGNQNSCPSTASVPRTYNFSSSSDKKRIEGKSNLNEKMLLEIISPRLIAMDYTDCQGRRWLFKVEKSRNSSKLQTSLMTKKTNTYKNQVIAAIDPIHLVLCPACEMVSEVIKKLKATIDLFNNQTGEIPGAIDIYWQMFSRDFTGAVESASWKAIESLTDKLMLNPLKDFLEALSNAALGCGASLQGYCAGLDYQEPLPPPQPQPQLPQGTGTCAPNTFKLPEEEDKVREVCRIRLQQWVKPGPPPYISYCGVWNATFVLSCEDFMKNGSPERRSN